MIKFYGNQHGSRVCFTGVHKKKIERIMKMTNRTLQQVFDDVIKTAEKIVAKAGNNGLPLKP